jgi:hypothetical protein
MPSLGPRTDIAVNAISAHIALKGGGKLLATSTKAFLDLYGIEQAIHDFSELGAAAFRDNEQIWVGEAIVESNLRASIKAFITNIANSP